MLALVMACALAVPVFAFSTDIDYTTPTGKWTAILEGAYPLVNGYEGPTNPEVVVVPYYGDGSGLKGGRMTIMDNVIKNPNMKVISLPKELADIGYGNGIENCTEITNRTIIRKHERY